jgi:hypothetical protein
MKCVLAGTAAAVLLAGCGGGGSSSAQTTTSQERFHYSAALRQSYMHACTRGGAVKESVCSCTLDKLSETVSTQDFRRMSLSGKIPPRIRTAITKAVEDCRKA